MQSGSKPRHPAQWVSFSGIDGAGKSTQIEALRAALRRAGRKVRIVRFWDDVAQLTALRETSGHQVFRGDKGIGSPGKPINRRDKNVRSWPMSCVRLFLYALDAASTRRKVAEVVRRGDFVIFDRYMYDELANLNLRNPMMRAFIRLVVKLVPRPDVAFILDADPEQARARKPEYPLEFIHVNRQAYLELSGMLGMTVIAPGAIAEVEREVLHHALESGKPRPRADGDVTNYGAESAALD